MTLLSYTFYTAGKRKESSARESVHAQTQGLTGSHGYMAPEFTDGRHGIKSDVYSYGVVSFS